MFEILIRSFLGKFEFKANFCPAGNSTAIDKWEKECGHKKQYYKLSN